MTCDPSEIANAACCFDQCVPQSLQMAIRTSLLCQAANGANPDTGNFRITDVGDFRVTDTGDNRIWKL